jgi:hypothetical protein
MKKCYKCTKTKSFCYFSKSRRSNDGYQDQCIECRQKYNNLPDIISKRKGRVGWFHGLKHRQLCFDCERSFPFYVLDYDHRDPTTKFRDVGALAVCSDKVLFAEIAKCDLVCANCHHIREAKRRTIRLKEPKYWSFYIKTKDVPCLDCKEKYLPEAMEFDHRDPSTKVKQVSAMLRHSLPKLIVEMSKCDIICRNCHRTRSHRTDDCNPECICLR